MLRDLFTIAGGIILAVVVLYWWFKPDDDPHHKTGPIWISLFLLANSQT